MGAKKVPSPVVRKSDEKFRSLRPVSGCYNYHYQYWLVAFALRIWHGLLFHTMLPSS